MKKVYFFAAVLSVIFVFSSCEELNEQIIVNDFEDVTLGESGYYNGSDKSGNLVDGRFIKSISTGSVSLINFYSETEWGASWSGFAVSSLRDSVNGGWVNQYNTVAGQGASGSQKFALVFDSASIHFPYINSYQKPQSVMVTNSTYAYRDMLNGSSFSKKFGQGDWFKVIFKGLSQGNETGSVEFFLADFRNGKSILIKDWTSVNLTSLGKVDDVKISFESSDMGQWGINTPQYVCLDNLKVAVSRD
jgi:hypothetical protein